MPLKDNKSWADPISNRIQIQIQKNVSKSYEKENEREREARPCHVCLLLLLLLFLLCVGELPTINVSTRSKYFGLSD